MIAAGDCIGRRRRQRGAGRRRRLDHGAGLWHGLAGAYGTDCDPSTSGNAEGLDELQAKRKRNPAIINTVTPGVFFLGARRRQFFFP